MLLYNRNYNFSKVAAFGLFCALFFCGMGTAQAQVWNVPEADGEALYPLTFDDDFVGEGRAAYSNSCMSCHGTPSAGDFTLMSPPPGDVASEHFQSQKDGELFYKIKNGRGSMPGFSEGLADEEIWSVVAYIRSFNSAYEQPKPDLGDIVIPELSLALSFDENIDKLVVKVMDKTTKAILPESGVSAYIKTAFGKYRLGNQKTNEFGYAYFHIDPKIPGDSVGNMTLMVKANFGYGSEKLTQVMKITAPVKPVNAIEGRHLWSIDAQAPIWIKLLFWVVIFGVWTVIFFVVIGLRNIKKG